MGKTTWLIVVLVFLVYTFRLDKVPVHLNQDELQFALNGYSISKTGTDEYSNYLPFYFWHLDHFWATPVITYSVAVVLTFLPLSEFNIRLATVIISLVSVVGLSVLVFKIFRNKLYSLITILLITTTPAFFINSRLLLDNIYPVLFVVFWLLLLKKKQIFLAGLVLGLGFHSYHASKIYMPVYFLTTLAYFYLSKYTKNFYATFTLGFLIPIFFFLPWLKQHPDTLLNQVSYANSIDSGFRLLDFSRIKSVTTSFIHYFSPRTLFFEGDRTFIHSTKEVGVFLFPTVFLLTFGVIEAIRRKDLFAKVIFCGFLMYPIAASIINDPQRVSRALVVIPFVVLLCIYGLDYLLNSKEKVLKYLVVIVFSWSTIQFVSFLGDYFGSYRGRSAESFNFDITGAMESAINSTRIRHVDYIFLDKTIPYAQKYFKFYKIKYNSNFENVSLFDPQMEDFTSFSKGSLVVIRPQFVKTRDEKIGDYEKIETIREPDGRETFWLFFKD